MPAALAIRTVLLASSAVTSLVKPANIYPVRLPQQVTREDAIVIARISGLPVPVLRAGSDRLRRDRIQVTAISADYARLATIIAAIDGACAYARGVIAGVQVITTEPALEGPDLTDDEQSLHIRSADYFVLYQQPIGA